MPGGRLFRQVAARAVIGHKQSPTRIRGNANAGRGNEQNRLMPPREWV